MEHPSKTVSSDDHRDFDNTPIHARLTTHDINGDRRTDQSDDVSVSQKDDDVESSYSKLLGELAAGDETVESEAKVAGGEGNDGGDTGKEDKKKGDRRKPPSTKRSVTMYMYMYLYGTGMMLHTHESSRLAWMGPGQHLLAPQTHNPFFPSELVVSSS